MSGVLGNRFVGILHGRLRHHSPYNEHTAWAHRMPAAAYRLRHGAGKTPVSPPSGDRQPANYGL
jgi:hypothetical protein